MIQTNYTQNKTAQFLAKAAHCFKFCFPHHKVTIFTNKGRVTGIQEHSSTK